ncbi:MAG TPA: thiamine pyrophosphate-dependent enzyme [Dehalococcoidales bacterium]|nr:thiamine pyrophosphate-dependent enzyme [Dehalococcoidales bacterium]
MVDATKKRNRIFDYFCTEEKFSGGVAWCAGCPLELTARFVAKVMGDNLVFVGTPSCSAPVLHGQNMGAWHKLPYLACVMTGVPSSATGLARYFNKTGQDATVVCFTGDGCASDVGFQPLSGAAERREKFIYICYDNEGYMNTGNQRSGATPLGAATTTTPVGKLSSGKPTIPKNLPLIMLMHRPAYMATATLSHLEDFAKKLVKAKEKKNEGFVYLHVFSPCPVGWRIDSNMVIEVCRTAVRTNYFPLWEAEDGKPRFTVEVANPKPVTEFTKLMRKFSHLKEDGLAELQKAVDERYALIKSLCECYK